VHTAATSWLALLLHQSRLACTSRASFLHAELLPHTMLAPRRLQPSPGHQETLCGLPCWPCCAWRRQLSRLWAMQHHLLTRKRLPYT
jgi:hypothetical protein